MPKRLVEIASELVQAQVSLTAMSAADMTSALRQVFNTLQEMQKAEIAGVNVALPPPGAETGQEISPEEKPALSPQDSIQNDKVICLECGAEFKQLTQRHLSGHGMSGKEYRKKYGFTMKTPLAAKSVVKLRSKIAKKRGLPENLKKFIEARRLEKVQSTAKAAVKQTVPEGAGKPKRTRIRKKTA